MPHRYPKSLDVWGCCNEKFTRFSKLIDHIEHHHILYKQDISGRMRSGHVYKHNCEQCGTKTFSFYAALIHHLSRHIEYKIFCSQCLVALLEEEFHRHVGECNLIEAELTGNLHQG